MASLPLFILFQAVVICAQKHCFCCLSFALSSNLIITVRYRNNHVSSITVVYFFSITQRRKYKPGPIYT